MFVVSGGLTTGGAYTDTTEVWMYGEQQWKIVDSAKLPVGIQAAAIVSIYNTLYLTGYTIFGF